MLIVNFYTGCLTRAPNCSSKLMYYIWRAHSNSSNWTVFVEKSLCSVWITGTLCVFMCLQDDTAAGCWVVCADLVLVAVDIVDVRVAFPLIVHLSDGDQLNSLPLWEREETVSTFWIIHLLSFFLSVRWISNLFLCVENEARVGTWLA